MSLVDGNPVAAVPDFAQHRIGTTVADRWHIDSLLGVGGMGVVYAATHRNGQRVALKFLRNEYCTIVEVRERFLAEAAIANLLGHPGMIRVSDDGITEDGSLYLVMELLEGQTLEEHLREAERPMPLERVASILTTLLDVLDAAHKAGVVHRDVKPANVFLCDDGSVRLLDFGVARAREVKSYSTLAGTTLGTPAFMSPEQARARWDQVDGRSDLFSVGATAYVLLTGMSVRRAASYAEEIVLAMTTPVISVSELRPDLPAGWVSLIDCALRFNKEERFTTAAAMRAALATCPTRSLPRTAPTLTATTLLAHLSPRPAAIAPSVSGDANLNRNARCSVAAWHTEDPQVYEGRRGTATGRRWRTVLVAALCLAPLVVSLRLNDTVLNDMLPAATLEAGVQDEHLAVGQPLQLGVTSTPSQPSVQEAPEVIGAALPVDMPALEQSPVARDAVLQHTEAPQTAVRLPRPMNKKRITLAVQRVADADTDLAKRRLAAALSERLMLEAPSEPVGRSSAGHRGQVFDPLERRN